MWAVWEIFCAPIPLSPVASSHHPDPHGPQNLPVAIVAKPSGSFGQSRQERLKSKQTPGFCRFIALFHILLLVARSHTNMGITSIKPTLFCMHTAYRIAADITVTLHLTYVAFVVFGLIAILGGYLRNWNWVRNPWFRWIRLSMILIVVAEAWCRITCPLTTLENWLREQAGEATYAGDFVATKVHDLLFFDLPTWCFTLAYTAFGVLVVATLFLVPIRPRQHAQTHEQHP